MAACSCCTLRVLFIVFIVCDLFFALSCILAFVVFPDVLYNEVNKATRLETGKEQFDRFMELPFPVDFKVYIFNVDNPEEVLNGTAKPKVTEVGPFVYKQYRRKKILDMDTEEDTITYEQTETFEFDAEASAPLTEDDVVTILNPPLMSIFHMADDFFDLPLGPLVEHCTVPTFPPGYDQVFITTPVRHLLFQGFNFCKNNGDDLCAIVNDLVCAIAATKRNADTLADYSLQFSFLNYKVRTPDGKYTVKRGMDDIDTLGHILAWNDMTYTTYWGEHTTCSHVQGTDSTLYPPGVTTHSSFYIFSTDICRYVEINYVGEATYKEVKGYQFGTSPTTLKPTTVNPEDDCYCSMLSKDANGTKSCFLDGVIDMQTCFGVPVLFSFPHFLWADEKYVNGVDGLSPDEEAHKTFLIVEPNTGTPLRGVKRIQLNAVIRPIPGIQALHNTKGSVIPLLWIEEGVALTDKYVDQIDTDYFDKVDILDGFKWALIAVSALLVVVFGGMVIQKRFFSKDYKK